MLKDFFRIGMTPGFLLSILIFNTVVEVLASREKKKAKHVYTEQKEKNETIIIHK